VVRPIHGRAVSASSPGPASLIEFGLSHAASPCHRRPAALPRCDTCASFGRAWSRAIAVTVCDVGFHGSGASRDGGASLGPHQGVVVVDENTMLFPWAFRAAPPWQTLQRPGSHELQWVFFALRLCMRSCTFSIVRCAEGLDKTSRITHGLLAFAASEEGPRVGLQT